MNQPTNKLNKELYKEITKLHDENVAKAYTLFIDGLTDSKAEALKVDIEQFTDDFVAYDTLEDWLTEWAESGVIFPELFTIASFNKVINYIDWVRYFNSQLKYDYTAYARTSTLGKDYSSGFINCSSFSYSEPHYKEYGHNQEVLSRLRNSPLIVFRRD